MDGYWNQPAANAAAFTADGDFLTGDVGMFDTRASWRSSAARKT